MHRYFCIGDAKQNTCMQSQGTVVFDQKVSKINKFLKRTCKTCDNEQDNVPSRSNVVKKQKLVQRQYGKDYIQYGFSWCGNKDVPKHSALSVGSNLQKKQWFLVNLFST